MHTMRYLKKSQSSPRIPVIRNSALFWNTLEMEILSRHLPWTLSPRTGTCTVATGGDIKVLGKSVCKARASYLAGARDITLTSVTLKRYPFNNQCSFGKFFREDVFHAACYLQHGITRHYSRSSYQGKSR